MGVGPPKEVKGRTHVANTDETWARARARNLKSNPAGRAPRPGGGPAVLPGSGIGFSQPTQFSTV
eukprot:237272-Hanusia_phi.AAC.1